uniref:AAA+ ATPase domain-containing protein n=1 Tax=Aureoumbra lagunensis TaxID=44058 RepID=A0A7S3JUL5_9STRA|mmetsp:Transcript_4532/g.6430  ORF Transcript_4532/g.6430 Transcript_4532/m.6430 type:complete len:405 (+) Transcript_4532:20-1234(+)
MEQSILDKGIDCARKAIASDHAGDYSEALKLYTQAIQYLLVYAKSQPESNKIIIRNRLEGYMSRAETLKVAMQQGLKPQTTNQQVSIVQDDDDDEDFDLRTELTKRVGMGEVKEKLLAFEHGIALDARRKQLSDGKFKTAAFPHSLMKGPPGCGKTSCARLIAKVLRKLKVLDQGQLVEVQRSDLVGTHIGHTAVKTRGIIEKARGGVLFVDECYRLSNRGENDFGTEAIDELMSAMENENIVMIFAGYNNEDMDKFISSNPGLFRRITHHFIFENYSPSELAQIFLLKVNASGFRLASPIHDNPSALTKMLLQYTTREQRERMNGGLCDHLLRNAKRHLDQRLTIDASVDDLLTYTEDDLIRAMRDLPTPPPMIVTTSTAAQHASDSGGGGIVVSSATRRFLG